MIHLRGRPRKPKPPKPPRTCKACGEEIYQKNVLYCESCRKSVKKQISDKWSERYKEKTKKIRAYCLEHHLCTFCGDPLPPDDMHHMCPDCRSYRADLQQARYQKFIDNRQCPLCRKKLPDGYYYVYCPTCKEKMNAKDKKRHERKKAV